MNPRTILFVGGSGVISAASVRLAVERGHEVTVLNRGKSSTRPLPDAVETLEADVSDGAATDDALAGREFDVVAQFLAFGPEHVAADIEQFAGRTGQYVFISSASAYQKPPARLPVTESTPLHNPFWQYSRDKIACEDLLVAAYREQDFPATIVRPSHTYDETLLPTIGRLDRRGPDASGQAGGRARRRDVPVDADPQRGLRGGVRRPARQSAALGEAFTITGTHAPTWNQIYTWLGQAAGVEPELVHVASETIAA